MLFLVIFLKIVTSVQSLGGEKIALQANFSDDIYRMDMSYGNKSVDITGHALVSDVRECVTLHHTFAPHCIKKVQIKWSEADVGLQRIPEFYFIPLENKNFSYYYDFGSEGPLFEGFKCCIIYDLLDCIHTEYKDKCLGLNFAPIDEMIHLFAMQIEDHCMGYHSNNLLYNITNNNMRRFHHKDRNDDKDCRRFLKSSHFQLDFDGLLIAIMAVISVGMF